jgi:lysophospholipase L1-like esterase
MATLGAWFYQAKQADVACVCYGVNDINRGFDAQTLKANLKTIVTALKEAGVKVLIQTIPPFDYNEQRTAVWNECNEYLLNELSTLADGVFDAALLLGKEDAPQMAKYVGHPNVEGCTLWAKQLALSLSKLLKYSFSNKIIGSYRFNPRKNQRMMGN